MKKTLLRTALHIVLLHLIAASSVHAGILWDYTITAYTQSSEPALQTVSYRYDPDSIQTARCSFDCEPLPPPFPNTAVEGGCNRTYIALWGPILSVTHKGLVNFTSGPTEVWSLHDACSDRVKIGNTYFSEMFYWDEEHGLKNPTSSVYEFYRGLSIGSMSGSGWWELRYPLELTWTRISLTPVPLPEPGTIALLAVFLVGIAGSSRVRLDAATFAAAFSQCVTYGATKRR